ncbi:hypothetical protein [uncultured Faecalibaculum sp.]
MRRRFIKCAVRGGMLRKGTAGSRKEKQQAVHPDS